MNEEELKGELPYEKRVYDGRTEMSLTHVRRSPPCFDYDIDEDIDEEWAYGWT